MKIHSSSTDICMLCPMHVQVRCLYHTQVNNHSNVVGPLEQKRSSDESVFNFPQLDVAAVVYKPKVNNMNGFSTPCDV